MTDNTSKCPDGWDTGRLVAYLEGDLPPDSARELELHLGECDICSKELEAVRKADILLKAHPEAFHPDPQTLVEFVAGERAEDRRLLRHLEECPDCKAEVDILRETVQAASEPSEATGAMPVGLKRRLRDLNDHPKVGSTSPADFYERMLDWLRLPFRAPMLGLGTAVAVLLIVVFVMPTAKDVEDPSQAPIEVNQTPHVTEPRALGEVAAEEEGLAGKSAGEVYGPVFGDAQEVGRPKTSQSRESTADSEKSFKTATRRTPQKREPQEPKSEGVVEGLLREVPETKADRNLKPGGRIPTAPSARPPTHFGAMPESPVEVDKTEPPDAAAWQSGDFKSRSKSKLEPGRSRPYRGFGTPEEKRVGLEESYIPTKDARVGHHLPKTPRSDEGFEGTGATTEELIGPVEVRIVDRKGRVIPWLRYVPEKNVRERYQFSGSLEEDSRDEDGRRRKVKEDQEAETSADQLLSRFLLKVEVGPAGPAFDIDARLIDNVSGKDLKRIQVLNVSKEDLEDRIRSLVDSMLGLK